MKSFPDYVAGLPDQHTPNKAWHRTKIMPCPLLNQCQVCKEFKNVFDFYRINKTKSKTGRKASLGGRIHSCCKTCQSSRYKNTPTEVKLYHAAKKRARQKGLDFSIEVSDIKIPDKCPMLGIPLVPATGKHALGNSPTLDRLDNHLGYVPGNVLVISHRANTIKGNATLDELNKIALYVEGMLAPSRQSADPW
jgi:hypothetical protein